LYILITTISRCLRIFLRVGGLYICLHYCIKFEPVDCLGAVQLYIFKSRTEQNQTKPLVFGTLATQHFKQQNVEFNDAVPSAMDTRGIIMDPFRGSDMIQDVQLSDWFKRPLKIASYQWDVGELLHETFDPWTLFWEDSANLNRIKNYKLLQCTLKVKFVVNGNSFYYGRLMAVYNPAHLDDEYKVTRSWVRADFINNSQKPHIYVNPTESQGGTLECPFFFPKNALDIVNKDWSKMGNITLSALQMLKHANGANAPVTVSVFAWAENVSYSVPTHYEPVTNLLFTSPNQRLRKEFLAEAGDEYGQGPVSKPASAVARVAGTLSQVPFIGNLARATEIGAKAVSGISSIFGYSSPTDLHRPMMIPTTTKNFAASNIPSDCAKLTMDCKQEVSIDPAILGLPPVDEMTISSIACRESFLTSFNWRVSDVEEQLLWNFYVDPCQAELYINPANEDETHMTAACVAALPFKYWRGTTRFRFQIVSSNYHKGRIKIVYDPHGGAGSSPYNTAYTHVHDIEEVRDFTMDVGWGQPDMFREHIPNALIGNSGYASSNSPLDPKLHSNGVLSIYVVNTLTVPNSVIQDNDIQVNCFISMLDDFQVAEPSDDVFRWRLTPESPPFPPPQQFHAEAGEEQSETDMSSEGWVSDPPSLTTFAAPASDEPNINHLFFGETICSYRQLVRRQQLQEILYKDSETLFSIETFFRTAFPAMGGFWPGSDSTMLTDIGRVQPYVYTSTNYINFITPCYAGYRGGFRWCFDTTNMTTAGAVFNNASYSVTRTSKAANTNLVTALEPPGTTSTKSVLLSRLGADGMSGTTRWNTVVNPVHTAEIPYYSNQRFRPARTKPVYSEVPELDTNGFKLDLIDNFSQDVTAKADVAYIYCSAAEDFQCYFWVGPPIYYKELVIPSS